MFVLDCRVTGLPVQRDSGYQYGTKLSLGREAVIRDREIEDQNKTPGKQGLKTRERFSRDLLLLDLVIRSDIQLSLDIN